MSIIDAIRDRRSARRFTDRPVRREEIEALLETATLPPNHRMTQPWFFYVLGERARRRYAELRGEMKSRKVDDAEAAAAVREKVVRETSSVPVMVAVAMSEDEDPMTREEDFAATFMGIENLLLAATDLGLAGYIHTGRILQRPEFREILGVPEDQRVVALLDLGEPAELPDPKPRDPAQRRTTWVD